MREGGGASVEMQTCIKVEGIVGVVSMETKSKGERRILFYPYFYLSDQRFGTHSHIGVAKKYGF